MNHVKIYLHDKFAPEMTELEVNRLNLWYFQVEASVLTGFAMHDMEDYVDHIIFEESKIFDYTQVWIVLRPRTEEENFTLMKNYMFLEEYFRNQAEANSPDAPDIMRIKFNLI